MFLLICLILITAAIVVATAKFNLHPFLSLLGAAIIMGLISGLGVDTVLTNLTEGFGSTLSSIGIVIAFGTVIGTFLELSGGAKSMASFILKLVGEKRAPLAMSITGFIVSIPVFCDSGFVILSTLNKALSHRTKISLSVLAVALATGLYATHVFVPPTPGPLAAAATLKADLGLVLLLGLIVAVPTTIVGLLWGLFYAKKFKIEPADLQEEEHELKNLPGYTVSFTPIIIPILLIALKSIADYPTLPFGDRGIKSIIDFAGNPVMALLIGVVLSFKISSDGNKSKRFEWVAIGLKNAGVIILITGAGGAFGNVLRATNIGGSLGKAFSMWHIGIILPFIIAAIIKSAQGSSTVSIITTAALIAPLLTTMGFDSSIGRVLVVLAIGAGSMTVSHVNDSYFWVVSQFSDMDTETALKCFTSASLFQGIVGIATVAVMSWILL